MEAANSSTYTSSAESGAGEVGTQPLLGRSRCWDAAAARAPPRLGRRGRDTAACDHARLQSSDADFAPRPSSNFTMRSAPAVRATSSGA